MLRLHNDEPTLRDALERKALVATVGKMIATCEPPHVFGIHGDWGSGKTSFLHQLHWYLTGGCPPLEDRPEGSINGLAEWGKDWAPVDNVTVVWFEAWRYQTEKAPVVALLQEIRTQLPWYSKLLNKGKKLAEVSIQSALLALEGMTKKIGIQASKIQAVGEKWEQEHLEATLPSHTIRNHLDQALQQLLGKRKGARELWPRLVVLVDDLDRCESEAAYKLLEGIKIYLNLPSCVFVLGMNQAVIESALAKHMAKDSKEKDEGARLLHARDYLEKLCKDIWHLPFHLTPEVLLGKWLEGHALEKELREVLQEERCLPANPRKIKAFANVLQRSCAKHAQLPAATPQPAKKRTAQLAVLMSYLYQFHQELYRVLEWKPAFYAKIRLWADGKPVENEAFAGLRPALAADPAAAGSDQKTPTLTPTLEDAYPDPVRGHVLRVQSLIRTLGTVTVTEISDHLLR